MEITEVKINLMPGQDPLKAYASIIFDNCFVVHDLRVIKTPEKTFVAMPSKKIKSGNRLEDSYKDIAHPIKKEMRIVIEKAVLDQYEQTVQSMS